jgi:hypothetical protein
LDKQTATSDLRAKARRCRELADAASDPEVATALREVAVEMEAALDIFEES